MNNELYLGPSVDVAQSNQLGSAALNILQGAPNLGHTKKINVEDYGALLVAYIILNDETVGLFIYDEDDSGYVHHQFISSRVERCLLAHAAEIAAPFIHYDGPFSSWVSPSHALPDVLLPSTLAHLTASQRIYRKIRAIRKSPTPVYAATSHLSKTVVLTRLAEQANNEADRERIERSKGFIAWLTDKPDDEIAQLVEGCRLIDRPKIFKVLFETPERVTSDTLRVLDEFDAFSAQVARRYAERFEITKTDAKLLVHQPSIRHLIDRGLIHGTCAAEVAFDINDNK